MKRDVNIPSSWLRPKWNAPKNVHALCTSRASPSGKDKLNTGYADFNLALHVGDEEARVKNNRQALAQMLDIKSSSFCWLNQVHGTNIVKANQELSTLDMPPEADAAFTNQTNIVCTVMTADCLPVLLCDTEGTIVAAIHAGWRSLAGGIISLTLKEFPDPSKVLAWLGPAISPRAFEVGAEVRQQFIDRNASNQKAFHPSTLIKKQLKGSQEKWMADLYRLARIELEENGILHISGGEHCTYAETDLFYSYRRDGATSGRMASIIWLES